MNCLKNFLFFLKENNFLFFLIFISEISGVNENKGKKTDYKVIKKVRSDPLQDSFYVKGEILSTIQGLDIFEDPKTFVDMPTKKPLKIVLQNFKKIKNKNKKEMIQFLEENFHSAGSDVHMFVPKDFKQFPFSLNSIKNEKVKKWALEINKRWLYLFRKYKKVEKGHATSFLETERPFIVPGGRFREFFYWDTYWIIKGLLVSGMTSSVEGMLENFFSFVKRFGYVPNGSRIYFLGRSQPPFLSMMTELYCKELSAKERKKYLKKKISFLEKEYQFWMENRVVEFRKGKDLHILNVYYSDRTIPRPESYSNDKEIEKTFITEKRNIFGEITAAAESGWDFSSRWTDHTNQLKTIQTSDIIPVDLQAFMFKNEILLSKMFKEIGDKKKSKLYSKAAERRKFAIKEILWDEQDQIWRDFNIVKKEFNNKNSYSSCFYPLYFGAFILEENITEKDFVKKIIEGRKWKELLKPGGISVSNVISGQQWDSPNAWSVDQDLFVTFLYEKNYYGDKKLKEIAIDVAQRFVDNVYSHWLHSKTFLEKYNASQLGEKGIGGEYVVQEGFGWTNGVVLNLLFLFKNDIKIKQEIEKQVKYRQKII